MLSWLTAYQLATPGEQDTQTVREVYTSIGQTSCEIKTVRTKERNRAVIADDTGYI